MSTGNASSALDALERANTQINELFSSLDSGPNATLQVKAETNAAEFVKAVAGIQQYLSSCGSVAPSSRRQQLEEEVQGLVQELSRAEQLLLKTDYVVQQWQNKCQELRAQHEAALTDGISSQPRAAPTSRE